MTTQDARGSWTDLRNTVPREGGWSQRIVFYDRIHTNVQNKANLNHVDEWLRGAAGKQSREGERDGHRMLLGSRFLWRVQKSEHGDGCTARHT